MQQGNISPSDLKPYEGEHAARVRDPKDFDTCRRKKLTDGIDIIYCRLKNSTSWEIQAYRFDSKKFTVTQAKKWLKDHDVSYILFEEAID